ncbi:hypothetical protein HG421_00975 [Xanthomonas campestris pv. badrii]|uniref:Uncharacterized protein n=1 Tax=Xanthomonas campestris pv. badrii TaxID=149696 RepID=A0A7Z2V7Z8_XANCA|nr:hypothetical protein [Xanthomonas campestris]MCC4606185.1 hypothetical protein [Xanthomonas campestris pv. parthenii]QJD66442.1 hypothetical protein HG421_00975 [Xanthomonas campestris pv. badrii]
MNQTSSPAAEAVAKADVDAGGRGLAKLNPSPRKAFEVTLTLKDAPGAFGLVQGAAQYDVSNEAECGKIQPETGTAGRITSQEDFALKKVSDTEYRGTVYLDLMQDEDYYGRGVCHWEFSGASVLLKATGAEEETRFLSFIEAKTVTAQQALTKYYWAKGYPRSESKSFPDTGELSAEQFKPDIRDELFTITLAAKEVAP